MSDEDFIINVSAPGAEQATRSVENLSAKLEELTEIMKNTGSGSKEFKTLKTEFDTISKAAREYSKVVSDINRTNSTAAISQQKLNSEINKAATQAAKLYTEQSKNALMQQKVATEMNKTAMAASRLQMQQERAAAASAKMQAAAAKAIEPYNRMRTELKDYEAKLYNADTFEEQWGNMFGFTFVGGETGPYWTDNPTGVSATKPNEFVSIRKSDYKTGKKIWSDFSDPALWSSYGKSTRTIMVYCNMVGDKTPATPTGGWWSATDKKLYNSENNKTSYKYNVLSDEERNKIPSDIYSETDKENIGYWQDDDNDVHDTITWVATGTFDEDRTNLDW